MNANNDELMPQNMPDKFLPPKQAQDNLELGSPVADQTQLAPFATSYINLLKTIIGSGILGLPYAFQRFGLIAGVSLIFIAAGTAMFGLHILNVAAMQLGRKSSVSGICAMTYPKAAFFFELLIAIKCIGTSIGYISAMGDMAESLGNTYVPADSKSFMAGLATSKAFWVLFLALCISPVCFMRRMDSLKYTSYAGMGAVCYLVVLTISNFFLSAGAKRSNIPLWPEFNIQTLKSYATLIFAYTCHQNILPIQNEARNNTPRGMMGVIGSSMLTATLFYLLVAVFGAASFEKVESNILKNFGNEIQYQIARLLYIVLLLFSFPLQVFPCRNSIEKMTLFYLRAERLPKQTMQLLYYGSTVGIIALTASVATLKFSLSTALDIVGTFAGNFICYLLPAVLFNKLYEGTPMNARRVGSYLLLGFGFVSFVVCATGNVAYIVSLFTSKKE